ncbi:MAG TPA: PQQ-binding-like beta-propeller repeat protein [Vicinamibacterales bacterium]|nr:PQQ-binding-like beta-propeller repeat protein [Vicinamibacterales bacterium]
MYAHDLAGTKFSPLKQITPDNAGRLQPAWNLTLVERPAGGQGRGRGGPELLSNPEVTPIVVNGVMYLLSAGNTISALDATTGKPIWQHKIDGDSTGRGVAFWPGDRNNPERILFTASAVKSGGPNASARLMALDAATGKPSEGFGTSGIVEIGVPWNGVPVVFRNLIVLGATVGEVPDGPPGDTRAFDARDGKKLWEFHTVARPGDLGHETWLDDGWKHRSGVNIWGWYITADEQRGILYMPVAGPAANYWGGDRPGNNLFANSIVAVDANTGKYKWHFQTVHHDLWDSDMPSPPTLVDIRQNGKTIPALASIGKTGYMFILNRETGKPIFGVEERPVPKGDVPGEWYSPTQPFPVKPPALTRVDFNKDRDMVRPEDTSAEHVKACQELWDKSGGFFNAGPFTPFMFHEEGAPPKSTIQFPGGTGGVNWGGPAADPSTGYVFVNAHDTSLVGWIEKVRPGQNYGRGTEGSRQPYDRGSVNGAGPYFTFSAPMRDENGRVVANLPCQRPPWARLVAVNANTGDIAWQVPLGVTDALPEGKRDTGGSGSAGPIVTGGGLVFVGATNDRRIRAFDAKNGKELWVAQLPGQGNANPITYTGKNGKQYVAIIATDSLQVFALP